VVHGLRLVERATSWRTSHVLNQTTHSRVLNEKKLPGRFLPPAIDRPMTDPRRRASFSLCTMFATCAVLAVIAATARRSMLLAAVLSVVVAVVAEDIVF
jgi:hypothetical protein